MDRTGEISFDLPISKFPVRQVFAETTRKLGSSGLRVTPIGLGCWPIAGVTTLGANNKDSLATIRKCLDVGINHFDTAYVYGRLGESETLIGQGLAGRRDEMVLATKCGIHFEGETMVTDGRPATLKAECEESLRRLATDRVDLLYLHSPDPQLPIADSAGTLRELWEQGKTRAVGVSNATVAQLEEFQATCPISAVQVPYNMLQRDVEERTIPWCQRHEVAVIVYWVLMKGLLAGRLQRDQPLAPGDSRRRYPMYQGAEWQKNQDFVDELRAIAVAVGSTVSQLVVAWTIQCRGITAALCGAKRAWQIEETAAAMKLQLEASQLGAIETAIANRGFAAGKRMMQ